MEPRRPFDPLRPIEPMPSPLRPRGENPALRENELGRLLKEILDRLIAIETRLKSIEDTLKSRK